MAGSDDGTHGLRKSHYNHQRSSARSDRSLRTPERPQSPRFVQDFTLRESGNDDISSPSDAPSPSDVPSPAPIIPRRRQSLDKSKRPGNIGGRRHETSLPGFASRSGNIDVYLSPSSFSNRHEVGIPSSPDNWLERTLYPPSTHSEERRGSGGSRRARRSWRSSFRTYPLSRRTTPATDHGITALPTIPDAAAEQTQEITNSSDEYAASRGSPRRQRASRFATELYTISYLILFAILGTLARLGLQDITFYPGAPLTFSELWANFAGTLVMGYLTEDSRLFHEEWGNAPAYNPEERHDEEKAVEWAEAHASHIKVKKTIPLYIGLATGFCGSFTSFSSFMRDIFFALSNNLPSPVNHPYPGSAAISTTSTLSRNGGYSFMAVCAVIIITIGLCYSALIVGGHLAIYTDRVTPTIPFRFFRRFVDPFFVFIAWGAWFGAVMMSIWPPDRPGGPHGKGSWADETWRGQAIYACVFAPIGCLLRFYLSLKLNGITPSFPLGTFTVNIFGTAVLGMAFDIQHQSLGPMGAAGGGIVGCQVLQGIMDGLCGALTTVSTWIMEINTLKRRHAYIYSTVSVSIGLGVLICVMGSVRWTVGWIDPVCVT